MRPTKRFYIILIVVMIIVATIIILSRVKNDSINQVMSETSKESKSINLVGNSIFKDVESLSSFSKNSKISNAKALEMYHLESSQIDEIDVRQTR